MNRMKSGMNYAIYGFTWVEKIELDNIIQRVECVFARLRVGLRSDWLKRVSTEALAPSEFDYVLRQRLNSVANVSLCI